MQTLINTILIVDDNPVILDILEEKLLNKIPNINILTAKTYKNGLRHILNKDIQIDLAILDIGLPEVKDGAIINFALQKNIPTIVLTGIKDDTIKRVYLEKNILSYIVKDGKRSLDYVVNNTYRILKNYDTNILLVDDSKVQLSVGLKILENMKFNVTTASNGKEALDILQNSDKKFSLVITDYNMPVMNGMELTLNIRDDYGKDELGIIVLSANDKPEIPIQFISAGANDFINKPYSQIEVATRINSNLELLELFQKTKDMANKDFMTGAYNRRFFFESGNIIFEKALREKKDLCVAMFDIDKFKNINDTHGHDVGDVAICEVANILNKNLRHSDLMARFGGEEFCVLLENITLEDAEKLFESIRVAFEQNIIKTNNLEIQFTTSIGISYGLKDNLEAMIKQADDGLYYCKDNGRNQIAINK